MATIVVLLDTEVIGRMMVDLPIRHAAMLVEACVTEGDKVKVLGCVGREVMRRQPAQ